MELHLFVVNMHFNIYYKHLPHQRKLSAPLKEKAVSLLEMKANKKLVQEKLTQESGKVILLKDLSNLAASINKSTKNDLDCVVKLLLNKYGKSILAIQLIHWV